MTVSRRKFLQIAGIGTIGAATGYPAFQYSRPALRHWLVEPDLPTGAATGSLDEATLQALQATAAALIEAPVETGHYRDFFQLDTGQVAGLFIELVARKKKRLCRVRGAVAGYLIGTRVNGILRSFQVGQANLEATKLRLQTILHRWPV